MTEPIDDTKMPLTSEDILKSKIEAVQIYFPEVFAEGKIDFAKLKQALGEFVDDSPERYGLSWAGKSEAVRAVQSLSSGTLIPCPDASVNWDTTENLFIEGDNLEVLKLLQRSYYGKVKMIYIDPPYNTGNEFIYPDNFREGLDSYLEYTGQLGDENVRLSTNTETNGRFHSNWLNMMYPRLFLARNLLRDDGVIFVSIDDNEVSNLRKLCDEIYGENNYIADIVWEKRYTRNNDAKMMCSVVDHILLFRKSEALSTLREPRTEKTDSIYLNPDNDPRGPWTSVSYISQRTKQQRQNLSYAIENPITRDIIEHPINAWKYSKEQYEIHVKENRLYWGKEGKHQYPRLKRFLSELNEGVVPVNLWNYKETGTIDDGTKILDSLIGKDVFDYPKPPSLLRRMMEMSTSEGDIILDFFSGSSTTAHAVLQLNKDIGGNRNFIMVQLPEPCDKNSEAYKVGFKTIADIGKQRIKLVIKKMNDEDNDKLKLQVSSQDRGFKVFKLSSSNFKLWSSTTAPTDEEDLAEQLKLYADHIMPGSTQEAILYEIMIKAGLSLTSAVEKKTVEGQTVFSINDGVMLVCLEDPIKQETVKGMIDLKPEVVFCLDHAFASNDQLKTNIVLEMKSHEIKFQTV